MRRLSFFTVVSATAALFATVGTAKALRIAIPNKDAAAQTVEAEVIVEGKVGDLEKELVIAPQAAFPNAPKIGYQVATIKISEAYLGAKGLTSIRVGWQPAANAAPAPVPLPGGANPAIRPAILPIRPGGGVQLITLSDGQEGCFFLKKHHEADFYVLVQWGRPIEKKAENYAKEIEQVKKTVKIFEKPIESLKAKETADRQLAAKLLLQKYRMYIQTSDGKPAKEEEIPAEESKLIMGIVASMDWAPANGTPFDPKMIYGQQTFYQLGVPQGEGTSYNPPKFQQGQDYNKIISEYTTKWLKDNAGTYRIKRFVAEKK